MGIYKYIYSIFTFFIVGRSFWLARKPIKCMHVSDISDLNTFIDNNITTVENIFWIGCCIEYKYPTYQVTSNDL